MKRIPYVTCVAKTPQNVRSHTSGLNENVDSATSEKYARSGTDTHPCHRQNSQADITGGCGSITRTAQMNRYATNAVGMK